MTGPFVRLLGDKGLASKYIRNAEQLLARVHGIRQATGVPVFAMRRLVPGAGAIIQAQSFGMIDVITIHALPIGEEQPRRRDPYGYFTGVVLWHDALRPMESPTSRHFQGVVLPIRAAEDALALAAGTYFDGPWNGPSAGNSANLGGPALMDDRDMYPMHSCAYHATFDMHAAVQVEESFTSPLGNYGSVYVGGVTVLHENWVSGGEHCYPIGARLYDDVLAVAYLRNYAKLVIRYYPLSLLAFNQPIVHDEENDTSPAHPRIDLGFEADVAHSIFDFNPKNKHEGTFIVSKDAQRTLVNDSSTTLTEDYCRYIVGKYLLDPNPAAPEDHFIVEQDTEQVYGQGGSFYKDQYGTLTAKILAPEYTETAVEDPGLGVWAWFGVSYFDVATTTAPLDFGESALFLETDPYDLDSRHYQRTESQSGTDSDETEYTTFYDSATGGPSPPPTGTMSSVSASVNTTIDFEMTRPFTVNASLTNLPIWTGYDETGRRFIRHLSGEASASRSGVTSYHRTYAGTLNAEIGRTFTSTYLYSDPPPPDPPVWDYYQLAGTWDGSYERHESSQSTYTLDSHYQSTSGTCTLAVDTGSGDQISWKTLSSYQTESSTYGRTGIRPAGNSNDFSHLVAPFGDRAVIYSGTQMKDLYALPSFHASSGTIEGTNVNGVFTVHATFNPPSIIMGPRLDMAPINRASPPISDDGYGTWKVLQGGMAQNNQFLADISITTGASETIYSTLGATVYTDAHAFQQDPSYAGRLVFRCNFGTNGRFTQEETGSIPNVGKIVVANEQFVVGSLEPMSDPDYSFADTMTLKIPRRVGGSVRLSDAFVGNRLTSACIYSERMGRHILSPYAMGNDVSPLRHVSGSPPRSVLVVGADKVNVNAQINESTQAKETPSAVQPVAADGFFADEADFFAPCALI